MQVGAGTFAQGEISKTKQIKNKIYSQTKNPNLAKNG